MSAPSDPHPPTEPAPGWSPSTAEIPVVATSGATAVGRSLPPHPDAAPAAPLTPTPAPTAAPAAAPVAAPQPTGPVDFVPGLPGLGSPPVPPPATTIPPPPVPTPVPPASMPQEPATPGQSWPHTLESEAGSEAGSGSEAPGRSRHLRGARGVLDRGALLGLGLAALALVLVLLGLSLGFGGESLWSTIPLWSAFATVCAALGVVAFVPFSPGGRRRTGWRVAAAGLLGLAVFWLLVALPNADTDRGFLFTAALGCLGAALWTGPRARS